MPLDATNFVTQDEVTLPVVIPNTDDENAVRVLQYALKLVVRGWTRGAYARCLCVPVPSKSWWATNYCADGAINKSGHNLGLSTVRAKEMLTAFTDGRGITDYNDKHNKKDVVVAFQRAITHYT